MRGRVLQGLRHWIDGDVAGGRALLADAASTCPHTFCETRIARGWLAAGPGAANAASNGASLPSTTKEVEVMPGDRVK